MKKLSVKMSNPETAFGWAYFVFQLLFLSPILIVINSFLPSPLSLANLNILLFSINLVCVLIIFHNFLWANLQNAFRHFYVTLRYAACGFVFYYLSSMLISILIFYFKPDFANVNDSSIAQMAGENYSFMALGTVLFVPIAEETLYRGLLFGSLHKHNAIVGYVVSAAVFAFIHVVGYMGAYDFTTLALCFLQYIPAGVFLAWSYVRADSILAPILIHITVNQIGILAVR